MPQTRVWTAQYARTQSIPKLRARVKHTRRRCRRKLAPAAPPPHLVARKHAHHDALLKVRLAAAQRGRRALHGVPDGIQAHGPVRVAHEHLAHRGAQRGLHRELRTAATQLPASSCAKITRVAPAPLANHHQGETARCKQPSARGAPNRRQLGDEALRGARGSVRKGDDHKRDVCPIYVLVPVRVLVFLAFLRGSACYLCGVFLPDLIRPPWRGSSSSSCPSRCLPQPRLSQPMA